MLNWVKFISAFLLTLVAVIAIAVLYNANKPISIAKKAAEDKVIQSGQLTHVRDVQPYNGTSSMITVFGNNADGENIAVFVQEDQTEKFQEVKLSEGITAKAAMDIVKKEQKDAQIKHALLGLEGDNPIWEVAFKNEHGKLNYVYIQFQDGKWLKRILNL